MCSSSSTRQNEQNPTTARPSTASRDDVAVATRPGSRSSARYISRVHGLVNDASLDRRGRRRGRLPTTSALDDASAVRHVTALRVPRDLRIRPAHVERLHGRRIDRLARRRPRQRPAGRSRRPERRRPSRCAARPRAANDVRIQRPRRRRRTPPAAGRRSSSARASRQAGRRPSGRSTSTSRRGSNAGASVTRYSAANTSRRCASIHAATSAPGAAPRRCRAARAPRAPTRRRPAGRSTNASPWIVAMPMRRPVNEPGPGRHGEQIDVGERTAVRVERARGARPAAARRACASRSPDRSATTRSSSTSATLPARVVVSSASTRMR